MTAVETFTAEERAALAPYFTDLDGPVFALINLPEVVKGALFARYSRSAKSLRRLFLDEFLETALLPLARCTQENNQRVCEEAESPAKRGPEKPVRPPDRDIQQRQERDDRRVDGQVNIEPLFRL